jgi:hypothetical protein
MGNILELQLELPITGKTKSFTVPILDIYKGLSFLARNKIKIFE